METLTGGWALLAAHRENNVPLVISILISFLVEVVATEEFVHAVQISS